MNAKTIYVYRVYNNDGMFYFKYVKIKKIKMMRQNVDFKIKPATKPIGQFKNFIIQTNISAHPENKT